MRPPNRCGSASCFQMTRAAPLQHRKQQEPGEQQLAEQAKQLISPFHFYEHYLLTNLTGGPICGAAQSHD